MACRTGGRRCIRLHAGRRSGAERDCRRGEGHIGAVLPGVTVEASSPALIEKVKSATTNEAGQYRIVDLRPGHLHGDVHADRVQHRRARRHRARSQLHGADQRGDEVGSVEETITVTGESAGRGRADQLSGARWSRRTLIEALPTGRNFQLMAGTGARRQHRRVRRRRLEHDVDRRQPAGARLADARFADADRRHGGRRDVRRRPVLVHLRQRSADAGNCGPGQRRQRREPDCRACSSTASRRPAATSSAAKFVALYANEQHAERQNIDDDLAARGITTPATSCTGSTTSTTAWAGRSVRTGCGSSSRAATGPTTTTWPTPSTRTAARRWTTTIVKSFPLRLTAQLDAARTG